MNRREIAVIIFILFAVALAATAWFFIAKKQSPSGVPAHGSPPAAGSGESGPLTRAPAPANVVVPEKGASVPSNVAPPKVVGAAAPNTSASYRSFDLKAEGGKFIPDTVIVRKNDTVRIAVAAVDNEYDFTQPDYGFRLSVARGETKWTEFSATAEGKFTFYCVACGGPGRGPIGYLVVAPE